MESEEILTKALEDAWAEFAELTPVDLPIGSVEVVIASRGPEVIVKSEPESYAIRFGPLDLKSPTYALTVLAHRAVHVLALQVTGFDPTSRQGRYHGTTYGNFAGQLDLGARLETGAVTFLGTRYQAWLKDHAGKLRQAMSRYRATLAVSAPRTDQLVKAVCECSTPKIGRFAQSTLNRGKGIKCGDCNRRFKPAT
jgi:hypothetical protein